MGETFEKRQCDLGPKFKRIKTNKNNFAGSTNSRRQTGNEQELIEAANKCGVS